MDKILNIYRDFFYFKVCDVQQCCAKSHFKSKLQCCTFGLPCDLYTCCVSNGGL
ncbi:unnamed protein product [Meloidogyne enterolobii]|uniref:Uncharacterized protein n=1 Tax=Meloidogyne enterolobii TaxID=390850 RepID=A0ACB0ZPT4_MELEN